MLRYAVKAVRPHIDGLRADGDAVISLVAVEGDDVVGHIVFSRMVAPFRALALGPVEVRPDRQGGGIGSRLIHAALEQARGACWDAVFVLGDGGIEVLRVRR